MYKRFIKLNVGLKTVGLFVINEAMNIFNVLGNLGLCTVLKHGRTVFPCYMANSVSPYSRTKSTKE